MTDRPMTPEELERHIHRVSAHVAAPASLRGSVVALAGERVMPRSRLRPRFALAAALVLVALLVALLAQPGGEEPAAPSVREVAPLALAEATAPAPQPRAGGLLDAEIDGIAFPDWSRWQATGERADRVGGRDVRTVFYENEDGQRIGYAIAAGDALPDAGGRYLDYDGAHVWVYDVDGATAVMWLRDGRTCIVAGRGVERETLLDLASARGA